MIRKLDAKDFRARRVILEPDDFALSDGKPDPSPMDLISQEAWNGIMILPGDVAIRTTNHQGTRAEILYELWSGWLHEIPHEGIVAEAMLDSADDFAAALFNLLHGFYKQALLLIAKVAADDLKMPREARVIYKKGSCKQYLAPRFEAVCLFYSSQLFP